MERIKIGGNFLKENKLINILKDLDNVELINITAFGLIKNINDLDAVIYLDEIINEEIIEFYKFFNINYIKVYELNNKLVYKLNDNKIYNNINYLLEELEVNIKKNIFYILASLNDIIEEKEKCTLGHALRVSYLTKRFVTYLHYDEEFVKTIYIGALLHDIGKIITPDTILFKPSKLTEEEYILIKEHTKIINNLLPSDEYKEIREIILHHHERIDGSGYPDKLTEKDITLGTRIVSIIDSYDAMTTSRSYNKIKNKLDAITEIKDCSKTINDGGKGLYYDNNLVNKFIAFVSL